MSHSVYGVSRLKSAEKAVLHIFQQAQRVDHQIELTSSSLLKIASTVSRYTMDTIMQILQLLHKIADFRQIKQLYFEICRSLSLEDFELITDVADGKSYVKISSELGVDRTTAWRRYKQVIRRCAEFIILMEGDDYAEFRFNA